MRRAAALLAVTLAAGPLRAAESDLSAVRAVQALAADDRPEAAEKLAGYLGDAAAPVRAAAVRALGRRRDVQLAPRLAALVQDGVPEVRDSALEALKALASEPMCGPAFRSALQGLDGPARARLVAIVAACPEDGARVAWGRSLGDPDASVRAAGERTLRLAPPEDAGRAMHLCLQPGGSDATFIACANLARELKLSAALENLTKAAIYDVGAPEIQAAARAAVRAMADEMNTPALAERARDAKDRTARAEALQLLSLVPGDRTYVALTKGLDDGDEYVRQVAASALGDFGDLRAVGPLSKALEAPRNGRIRKSIQRALDRLTRR